MCWLLGFLLLAHCVSLLVTLGSTSSLLQRCRCVLPEVGPDALPDFSDGYGRMKLVQFVNVSARMGSSSNPDNMCSLV